VQHSSHSDSPYSDALIIGGGLGGLTAALHLAKAGLSVRVLEKEAYPRHKVCGEYISNEVLPYLKTLGIDPMAAGATHLQRCLLSAESGRSVEAPLPLGGFGLSRYRLDELLYEAVVAAGGAVQFAEVTDVQAGTGLTQVRTRRSGSYQARIVIGAYGKRSRLDKKLNRAFINRKTPYLAAKAHYSGDFPEDLVALYCFPGGYCGVSKVEDGRINVCYLAHERTFKNYQNLAAYEEGVLYQNPELKTILTQLTPIFERPLTISQISFAPKRQAHDQLLLVGDAAGMIHPLCGNGMGMAIVGARLLAKNILTHLDKPAFQATQLAEAYSKDWKEEFQHRLNFGRLFNTLFYQPTYFEWAVKGLSYLPWALPFFVRQTHGQPILEDQ
jgi:flavin-dependent dehydrogenase